jgi:hypothetical protein
VGGNPIGAIDPSGLDSDRIDVNRDRCELDIDCISTATPSPTPTPTAVPGTPRLLPTSPISLLTQRIKGATNQITQCIRDYVRDNPSATIEAVVSKLAGVFELPYVEVNQFRLAINEAIRSIRDHHCAATSSTDAERAACISNWNLPPVNQF